MFVMEGFKMYGKEWATERRYYGIDDQQVEVELIDAPRPEVAPRYYSCAMNPEWITGYEREKMERCFCIRCSEVMSFVKGELMCGMCQAREMHELAGLDNLANGDC